MLALWAASASDRKIGSAWAVISWEWCWSLGICKKFTAVNFPPETTACTCTGPNPTSTVSPLYVPSLYFEPLDELLASLVDAPAESPDELGDDELEGEALAE